MKRLEAARSSEAARPRRKPTAVPQKRVKEQVRRQRRTWSGCSVVERKLVSILSVFTYCVHSTRH